MSYAGYSEFVNEVKESDEYWIESAKLDFALELHELMKSKNVNKAGLAVKIKKSPAYISKVLKGDTNFTIETMVGLSRAIGCRLSIHIAPSESRTKWFDVIESRKVPDKLAAQCGWKNISAMNMHRVEYKDGQPVAA